MFCKVVVLALVFEAEEAAFPDIGESVAAFMLGRAFFKAKTLAGRIGGGSSVRVVEAA